VYVCTWKSLIRDKPIFMSWPQDPCFDARQVNAAACCASSWASLLRPSPTLVIPLAFNDENTWPRAPPFQHALLLCRRYKKCTKNREWCVALACLAPPCMCMPTNKGRIASAVAAQMKSFVWFRLHQACYH
jgi:hypothetical protein